jgi:aryl-alcohol dehydrogenase-like predicted oxidoreductase
MEYTYFGDTGLEVSELCLGCGGFSYSTEWEWTLADREASVEVIERALDAGINFVDTANVYSLGESEEIVGEVIQGRRDELVVASKVGQPLEMRPNRRGLSRKHVVEQVEKSLDRLRTDYLDLCYIHQWDYRTPIEETLSALTYLVDEGLVRYVGASNLAGWHLMKALGASDAEGYARFVAVQPEYSLVRRHEEENLLPVARDQSLGVASYSPLAAGFLTGQYDRETDRDVLRADDETWRDLSEFATDDSWAVLDVVREIADREGATPVEVSVAWLLESDVVDAPVIGPRSVAHVDEYLGALEVSLSEADLARLEAPIDPSWDHSLVASTRW